MAFNFVKTDKQLLAEKIITLMRNKKITQQKAIEVCHVSDATIKQIMQLDLGRIDTEKLKRILEILQKTFG